MALTLYAKIGLIMRLTTVILLISLMQVSAATFGQRITMAQHNVPLELILKEIRKQSGYDYLSEQKAALKSNKVTVEVRNATVEEALNQALKGLELTYEISDKNITIKTKQAGLIENLIARFQEITVTGKVVDENGRALSGATVTVKSTGKGTSTKADGTFAMSGVEEGTILLVKFLGYESLEIQAAKGFGVIKLQVSENALDQVVIRAYDQTSQRLSTGNITTITAKQLENKPVTNPLLALQGLVPGLNITQSTGWSKSGVTVQIQGPGSIAKGNMPFYVIDGVPYPSQNLPSIGPSILGQSGGSNDAPQQGNPLNYINPQDIESISILKDADATAIYGSQAANGAILITTKKPKAGVSNVSISLEQGIARVPKFLDVMKREHYLKMRKDAYFIADGLTVNSPQFATQYDLNGVWDSSRETDWQKYFIGGTAKYTNVRGSLSGGSTQNQYLLSGTYNRQTTVLPMDNSDQSGSVLINLNHANSTNRFKAQFSGIYSFDLNRLPISDPTLTAIQLSPVAPILYNENGTLNWQPNLAGSSSWTNPLAIFRRKSSNKTTNLVSNLGLSYQLLENLQFSSNIGYTNLQQDEIVTNPQTSLSPERIARNILASSQFSTGNMNSWIIEPKINFTKIISKGKLMAFAAATLRRSNANYKALNAQNYSSDLLLQDLSSAGIITSAGTSNSQYRYAAIFGHMGYTYDEKYIINADIRRDGSSRFGSNNKFHNFWSMSGGWIFSQEGWIARHFTSLSYGKLYASYGTTGSDNIGDYTYLSLYRSLGGDATYQGALAYIPTGLPNADIQWEETKKLNLGLSLGFLKDRILMTANYYVNRTGNQLLGYALPPTTGNGGITANFPATVQNSGWELSINSKPIIMKNFQWNTNFNISLNRNKLLSFPDIEKSSYSNSLKIGLPIALENTTKFAGLNPQTGLYQFYKGDGTIITWDQLSFPSDYLYVSRLPKFSGGWSNSLGYKDFLLDFTFQYVKQIKKNTLLFGLGQGNYSPGQMSNEPESLKYWIQPGDKTINQKLSAINDFNVYAPYAFGADSNIAFQNGSFIRLENIAFSYKLPINWVKKFGLKNMMLSYNIQNVLTITKFKGFDPESNITSLPPLRVMTFSLKANL